MSVTARTICTDAAQELGVIGQGETLSANDAACFLGFLTRLIDSMNAEKAAIYAVEFLTFTFTPSLNPHTIGPTGATWTVTERPVSIDGAIVLLGNGVNAPSIDLDHDASWWQNLSTPTLTTSYPTDGYYDPTWPNGSLYLWPVPSTAYQVQLQVGMTLASYTLDTAFSMPPGYRDAVTLTLAENSSEAFSKPVSQKLEQRAAKARGLIYGNNDVTPKITTQDSGMPSRSSGPRSNFNYYTGYPW